MSGYAYFIAKCESAKTDPTEARAFAKSIGLELWVPDEQIPDASIGAAYGGNKCLQAMNDSECAIVVPPIGADCGWEIGWFAGKGRSVYVLGNLIGHWMPPLRVIYVKKPLIQDWQDVATRMTARAAQAERSRDEWRDIAEKSNKALAAITNQVREAHAPTTQPVDWTKK